MKQFLTIIILLFNLSFRLSAQEDPQVKQQRIEALKIAYISQKLNISTSEAEKFWPVYYKYESELKQVHKEANTLDVIDKDERILNIRKKYKTEFSGLLGANRANNLYKSEGEFRSVLIRHMQRQNSPRLLQNTPKNNSQNKMLLNNKR